MKQEGGREGAGAETQPGGGSPAAGAAVVPKIEGQDIKLEAAGAEGASAQGTMAAAVEMPAAGSALVPVNKTLELLKAEAGVVAATGAEANKEGKDGGPGEGTPTSGAEEEPGNAGGGSAAAGGGGRKPRADRRSTGGRNRGRSAAGTPVEGSIASENEEPNTNGEEGSMEAGWIGRNRPSRAAALAARPKVQGQLSGRLADVVTGPPVGAGYVASRFAGRAGRMQRRQQVRVRGGDGC